jgi:gliding motility-associated-like protein
LSSNANLSALTLGSGSLTPAFSANTTHYTASVGNTTGAIYIIPTASDTTATLTVNGTPLASGAGSESIALNTGSNTISVVVTAQDGTTKTYTVVVTRSTATNVGLSNLAINAGTLSPAFSNGTTSYTASVTNATASIRVTPTATNATATIKVNGVTVASGSASGVIPLNIGPNTITAVVTETDASTTTYTLTVTRTGSANANLAGLAISSGTLNPAFASGTTSYTASVGGGIMSITVTPTAGDAGATITVNGTAVSSGSASPAISLNPGNNVITTVVTAQDGTTTKTYTLTVNKAPSPNANLSLLRLVGADLSPAFTTANTSYTATVADSITSAIVKPTTTVAGATVKVNGQPVASGASSASIPLSEGLNTITTVVTAQDGVTTKTYTIVVGRGSSNTNLSNLKISGAALSPAFNFSTTSYTATVGNTVSSVTVTPHTGQATATVKVNGTAVASGTPSDPIALSVGPNIINTVVTAQDSITTETYTVTVTRAPSANANILQLKLSSGTLSPSFAQATVSYTASVANAVSSITVTPAASDAANAVIKVNGTVVASHTASGAIPLSVGSNTVTLVCTAQDGVTTKTYTITVTRASGSLNSVYQPVSVSQPVNDPRLADNIIVHQGLSPNGDGINDVLIIDGIGNYPDNKLAIMSRNGELVFEATGYDNSSSVFDGHSNKTGKLQQPGTYFYSLEYKTGDVIKHKTGFIVIKY